jgi:hypothetical protein
MVARPTPSRQLEQRTGLVVGQAVRHGNLTIFPVYSLLPRDSDRFITLDEGLKAGTVEIRETGSVQAANNAPQPVLPQHAAPQYAPPTATDPFLEDGPANQAAAVADFETLVDLAGGSSSWSGNDVNRLLVVNRSDKPLYLMPGEILLGGDQDRTVGQELVIAPSQEPVPIDVFCVEHGRWGQRDAAEWDGYLQTGSSGQISGFSTNLSLVVSQTQDVRPESWTDAAIAETRSGKFIGSVGSLSKSARMAVQADQEQGKVWDEVASENAKAGVRSGSGAFTGNYAEAEAVRRLEPYLESLRRPIADIPKVVGVIVAVNGKLESLDVFESTPLFRKLWPKLLKSYALDAANAQSPDVKPKSCTQGDAVAFFHRASHSQPQKSESKSGMETLVNDTDDVLLFSAREAQPAQRPFATQISGLSIDEVAAPTVSFGGAIHSAGYAKKK